MGIKENLYKIYAHGLLTIIYNVFFLCFIGSVLDSWWTLWDQESYFHWGSIIMSSTKGVVEGI